MVGLGRRRVGGGSERQNSSPRPGSSRHLPPWRASAGRRPPRAPRLDPLSAPLSRAARRSGKSLSRDRASARNGSSGGERAACAGSDLAPGRSSSRPDWMFPIAQLRFWPVPRPRCASAPREEPAPHRRVEHASFAIRAATASTEHGTATDRGLAEASPSRRRRLSDSGADMCRWSILARFRRVSIVPSPRGAPR